MNRLSRRVIYFYCLSTWGGSNVWSQESLYGICGWQSNDRCRSRWSRRLRHGPVAARLLRLLVQIPPGAWISVSWDYCVLSGISLCVGPITRPEQSYRIWCVWGWSRNLNDGRWFSPSTSVFSCRYRSTNIPYSFIRHLRCITLASHNFVNPLNPELNPIFYLLALLGAHHFLLQKANGAFVQLYPVWRNNNISTRTKLRIFRSNVKSVLLYGSETWKVAKTTISKLQVFVNCCLRRILNIHWPEVI